MAEKTRDSETVDVVKLEKKPMQKYDDGINDHYIDVLRARLRKKEANAHLYNSSNTTSATKDEQEIKKKQTRDLRKQVTYDDSGKIMNVNNIKVEKLPNLTGPKPNYKFQMAKTEKPKKIEDKNKQKKVENPVRNESNSS